MSRRLYHQSSKLRAMARLFAGNGDTERPNMTFNAVELDGLSSLFIAAANRVDATRYMMFELRDQDAQVCLGSDTKRTEAGGYTVIRKTDDLLPNIPPETARTGKSLLRD